MTTPVGPYTLTGIGIPLNVPVPPGVFTTVVVDNASPYTCAVNIGSPQHWLEAFTSDIYDIPAGATVTITPTAALVGASTDATLTATFYRADETPGGTYPVSLTSQAVVAALTGTVLASILGTVPILAQQQLLKTGTVVANPGASVVAIPVPAWCRKAVVIVTGLSGSDVQNVQLNGEISQAGSIDWTASGNGQGTVVLAGSLYGTVDTLVDLFVLLTGGPLPGSPSSFSYWVVAVESDDVVGNPVNGQNVQSTDFEYCDGVADTFATATMTTGGAVALIPAPPAGFLTKITSLSLANTGAAVVRSNLVAGGAAFAWATLPVTTGTGFVPGPFVVATAVTCNISAASTSVFFTASYKLVPLLR